MKTLYCFFFGHDYKLVREEVKWFEAHCRCCNDYEVKKKNIVPLPKLYSVPDRPLNQERN